MIPLYRMMPEEERREVGEARKRRAAKRYLARCRFKKGPNPNFIDYPTAALVALCRRLKPVWWLYQKHIDAMRKLGWHEMAEREVASLNRDGHCVV